MIPDLSVVVLCYRSGEDARAFAASIAAALVGVGIVDYQLVLVGNYIAGSSDPTPEVVRDLAARDPRILCSAVPKEGMMGWDMRSGLALSTGRVLAVIDGDGQVLVQDLVRTYQALVERGLDLTKTYRVKRGDGVRRKILSLGFNALFHLLFPGLKARDINSKPKVMARSAYERLALQSDDWFIDAEIMIQARRLKFRIGELETEFLGLDGRSSFVRLSAVAEFVRNLVRYRLLEFHRSAAR